MRVLIAGGGIGGLTAALCLHKAGFLVDVRERTPHFGDVGAGVQLGPNAMQVFDRLGLADAIAERAMAPERLEMRDGVTGHSIFSIAAGQQMHQRYGAPYLHIHRPDLVDVLSAALRERVPDGLHLSSEIVELETTRFGVLVSFANGKGVRAAIAIGADGVSSIVRRGLEGPKAANFSGYVAWRSLVTTDETLNALIPSAATVWTGPDRHAVTYRLRPALINFVGVVRQPEWAREGWSELGDADDLKADFAGFAEPIRALVSRAERSFKWAIREQAPDRLWGQGNITLLGDAAHAMPPFMAQGAAMAIEDAWTLAEKLSQQTSTPAKGLRAYEAERQKRTSRVQAAAWRNLAVFHTDSGGRGKRLRGMLKLANRVAPPLIHSGTHWIYNWKPGPLTPK